MEDTEGYNDVPKRRAVNVQQRAHSARRRVKNAASLKILRLEGQNFIEGLV
jgi:hypothetical protein